ncbi:hypothetical protein AAE026_32445 [Bradyrhizobium sp. DN5]|uniref:hypothetical protein n=1 Tax=Bradyrhizobium sp. DN5 TaxID=3056950 RepID=UPI00352328D2
MKLVKDTMIVGDKILFHGKYPALLWGNPSPPHQFHQIEGFRRPSSGWDDGTVGRPIAIAARPLAGRPDTQISKDRGGLEAMMSGRNGAIIRISNASWMRRECCVSDV